MKCKVCEKPIVDMVCYDEDCCSILCLSKKIRSTIEIIDNDKMIFLSLEIIRIQAPPELREKAIKYLSAMFDKN